MGGLDLELRSSPISVTESRDWKLDMKLESSFRRVWKLG